MLCGSSASSRGRHLSCSLCPHECVPLARFEKVTRDTGVRPLMQEPYFRLHTYGSAGAVTIDFRSSSDAFLTFDAVKEVTYVIKQFPGREQAGGHGTRPSPRNARSNTFHLKLLENNLRALSLASQVCCASVKSVSPHLFQSSAPHFS